MKKYLLGTMMLVGAIAYGQGNQVIVPLNAQGLAQTTLNVEVEGKVFEKTDRSLVIEIKSASTPDGRGFSFQMPDLFAGQEGTNVTGKFVASIQTDGVKEAFKHDDTFAINLLDNADAPRTNIPNAPVVGTANDTTLNYTLTGVSKTGDLEHTGLINVQAKAGNKVGSYSDNAVKLQIKVHND